MKKKWTESDWYVPGDWMAIAGFHLAAILGLGVALFLPWLAGVRCFGWGTGSDHRKEEGQSEQDG